MNYYSLGIRQASMYLFDETQSSVTFDAWTPYEFRHCIAPEFCYSTNCRNKNLFALILSSLKMCLTCSALCFDYIHFIFFFIFLLLACLLLSFSHRAKYHHTQCCVYAMWIQLVTCVVFFFSSQSLYIVANVCFPWSQITKT